MQFTKDSFYMALRERLAVLDPQRTIALNGAIRPAVVVAENEPVTAAPPLADTFYLHWGACEMVKTTASAALFSLQCTVTYSTVGSANAAVDRGRALAALDAELLAACSPRRAPKRDYGSTPPLELGTNLFWAAPQFSEPERAGPGLRRNAMLTIFFFSEESS